jgi:hypothetical protein
MYDDVATAWTAERRRTLKELDQGDVIEDLCFGYVGQRAHGAALPSLDLPDGGSPQYVPLPERFVPRYAVITSQSCDLAEEADEPKKPWFLAAPVYNRTDLGERSRVQVEILKVQYLWHLNGADLGEGYWITDLRLQAPFDKAVLVGRQVLQGFANESDRDRFAEHLSDLFSRPAFPAAATTIVESLRDFFNKSDKRLSDVRAAGIREVRLRCVGDGPYDAQVMVIVEERASAEPALALLKVWYSAAFGKAQARNVTLHPPECDLLAFVTAEKYLSYHRVSLEYLTRRAVPIVQGSISSSSSIRDN